MSAFKELEIHAMNDNTPTEAEYAQYSHQCGVPVATLKVVYLHLRTAEFHFEEERFDNASLNRARAMKNLEKARKAYKEGHSE